MTVNRAFICAVTLAIGACQLQQPEILLPESSYITLVNSSAANEHLWENAYCGGVLASTDLVATATHCLEGDNLPDVVIGQLDLCKPTEPITRIGTIERIDGAGATAELTLLRLAIDTPLSPIEIGDTLTPGQPATAVGWGRTTAESQRPCVAKVVNLMTEPIETCERVLELAQNAGVGPGASTCMLPARTANTCIGDSGGGTYAEQNGELHVVGLVLGGSGCGPGDPGIYIPPTAIRELLQATEGAAVSPSSPREANP